MIGAGEQRSVLRLLQAQDVAPRQSAAGLPPVLADIVGQEQAALLLVIGHSHIEPVRVLAVYNHGANHAMGESLVRACVVRKTVVAGQYSPCLLYTSPSP